MVEVDQAQETAKLAGCGGLRVALDGVNVTVENSNAGGKDTMTEKVQRRDSELAVLQIDDDAVVREKLEHLAQVLKVSRRIQADNEQIVQVHETEQQATKDLVHETLKRLRCVAEAERHADELEEAEGSDDSGLRDVVRVYGDLVVSPNEVDLGENRASRDLCYEVLDVGNGVAVRDSSCIQGAVVATRSPDTRWLAYHV